MGLRRKNTSRPIRYIFSFSWVFAQNEERIKCLDILISTKKHMYNKLIDNAIISARSVENVSPTCGGATNKGLDDSVRSIGWEGLIAFRGKLS